MDETNNQSLILKKNSQSGRFSSWKGKANSFRDKLFRSIYIFLLFAIDFVMFIYSINGRLIEDGRFNPAIAVILGSIFAISFVLLLCLSFSKILQNIVCSVVTLLVVTMFFYQFGLGDVDNFIENWLNKHASWLTFFCIIPSPWMVGLAFAGLIFFMFYFSDAILFVTLVLLFSGIIGIQKNEFLRPLDSEYQVIKEMSARRKSDNDKNVVYFMIPKLPSYQFLNSVNDPNFRELRDLLLGFYAFNNFEVYPNAFVQKNDTMSNMIDILNQVDYTSTTSANRGYSEFVNNWNFVHGGLDILNLEDSRLYDYFHSNGYGVSMYAMPGFNFCFKGNDYATDRCVVKGYKNVSLFNKSESVERNVYALLGEWVLSLQKRSLKSFAKMLINMSPLKNMKVLSENRRVNIEGSPAIFDNLGNDIRRDVGSQVYLAYVDLPSDVYIYDEYCNLKPRKDWVALKDNSLFSGGIDEKRKAYVDQAKCLIGKLQEYMGDLHESGKAGYTDVYIQGVSPTLELAGMLGDSYNRFVAENLVNLAIRKAEHPKFLINANVCLASDFTKTLIQYQDYCFNLENIKKMKSEEAYSMRQNLINNSVIRGRRISNIIGNYGDWYELYRSNNRAYIDKVQKLNKNEKARKDESALRRAKQEQNLARNGKEKRDLNRDSETNIFVLDDDVSNDFDTVQKYQEEDVLPQSDESDQGKAQDVLADKQEEPSSGDTLDPNDEVKSNQNDSQKNGSIDLELF